MNGDKLTTQDVSSYAGSAIAIGSSLTLTQFGVIVGILTGLLTFVMNMIFNYRKDKREQMEADLLRHEMQMRIKLLEQQSVAKP